MRLPIASDAAGLDVALTGIPFDGGTTNRPGARHGPREMRNQSSLIRAVSGQGVAPFETLRVADLGDCPVNPMDIGASLALIEAHIRAIEAAGAIPLVAGGDHLVTLGVLRGLSEVRPLALLHFDAHSDTNDTYFGANPYTHGSPFRRAVEEGLIDGARSVQIGIRGTVYHASDFDFAKAHGFRIMPIEEVTERSVREVIAEYREIIGSRPVYVSFDIDSLDPSIAPGTGTPEIGGLTAREAQALLRGMAGLDIRGADVVEVSPPFDPSGVTALAGATMMFEILCAIAQRPERA